ncbi:MAG: hypothetical protein U0V73_05145 [Acidimicrobiia bacterium]
MSVRPPAVIACVDCGGECHLLTKPAEDGWVVGEIVSYRCVDCLDRWDVELSDDDREEGGR